MLMYTAAVELMMWSCVIDDILLIGIFSRFSSQNQLSDVIVSSMTDCSFRTNMRVLTRQQLNNHFNYAYIMQKPDDNTYS